VFLHDALRRLQSPTHEHLVRPPEEASDRSGRAVMDLFSMAGRAPRVGEAAALPIRQELPLVGVVMERYPEHTERDVAADDAVGNDSVECSEIPAASADDDLDHAVRRVVAPVGVQGQAALVPPPPLKELSAGSQAMSPAASATGSPAVGVGVGEAVAPRDQLPCSAPGSGRGERLVVDGDLVDSTIVVVAGERACPPECEHTRAGVGLARDGRAADVLTVYVQDKGRAAPDHRQVVPPRCPQRAHGVLTLLRG
jgi:hypothetical protein